MATEGQKWGQKKDCQQNIKEQMDKEIEEVRA